MVQDPPFAPGFGVDPPFFAGRSELTHDTLRRIRRGPGHEFHTIVLGPRGSGKTVWLNSVADFVRDELQSVVIEWNASDRDRPLRVAISEQAPAAERELASRLRRGIKRLEGGVTLKAAPAGVGGEVSTAVRAGEQPTEGSVVHMLTRLGTLAASRRRVLVLRVDELQAGSDAGLTTLGAAIQTVSNEAGLPVSLLAVGLPSTQQVLHDMAVGQNPSPSAGFLERQQLHWIGNLDTDATYDAFERPIEAAGWSLTGEALDELVARSNGYPFAVQLIGEQTWLAAATPGHIDVADVDRGVNAAAQRLEGHVFVPRWRTMSATDRDYLVHAARLRDTDGSASAGEISRAMYGTATSASQNRRRLIEHHHVLEPAGRGRVRFTLPGMADWIGRDRGLDHGLDP